MQNPGRHRLSLLALAIALAPALLFAQTPPAQSSGALDPSFGVSGRVTTDFGGTGAAARTVAVQPDGKILSAGLAAINGVLKFALGPAHPDGHPRRSS